MRYADINMSRPTGLKNEQVIFANRIAEKVNAGRRIDLPQLAQEAGYLEMPNIKKELRNPRFKEYLAEQLTDEVLVDTHKALLGADINSQTRLNAVRLGYEIRGHLSNSPQPNHNTFNIARVSWGLDTQNTTPTIDVQAESTQSEANE